MTTIRVKDGFSYTISADDYLWLGRAASGEGGKPAAVIWTWIQRFAGLPERRAQYGTLAALVRAHSQPVNPAWLATGRHCAPGGRGHGGAYCSPERIANRERHIAMQPAAFDADVKLALAQLAAGILSNPVPRAVDFADRPTSDAFVARTPGSRILACYNGNCHIATRESMAWPLEYVSIGPGSVFWWALGGFGLGAAALGGWLWWRSR